MNYIFKQKLHLNELVNLPEKRVNILIVEPEEELFGIYALHIKHPALHAHHCQELHYIPMHIANLEPSALVVNLEFKEGPKMVYKMLEQIKNSHPNLPVITLSYDQDPNILKQFMNLGIVSHINRKLSRPQDLAVVIGTILNF